MIALPKITMIYKVAALKKQENHLSSEFQFFFIKNDISILSILKLTPGVCGCVCVRVWYDAYL